MDYRAVLLEENRRLGELLRRADETVAVPTCPGWTLRQLFRHTGRGHYWSAQIVAERRSSPLDPREVRDGKPPTDPDAALAWFDDGAQRLLDAVDDVGADTPVWTFVGPRPAAWWIRRRLHEATVHRADAALALRTEVELAAPVAADAVTEWLELITAGSASTAPLDDGASLHLHATEADLDPSGEWVLRRDGAAVTLHHEHQKADAAVRGRAEDLLLGLTRRIDPDDRRLDVVGDAAVWRTWLARTPF